MIMTTEECHREEVQAFATRTSPLPADGTRPSKPHPSTQNVILRKCRPSQREGLPTKDPCPTHRRGGPDSRVSFCSRGCPVQARLGGLSLG